MALNIGSFIQATQQAGQFNPVGDMRERRSERQLRQAQGIGLEASARSADAATETYNFELEAKRAAKKKQDSLLIAVGPLMDAEHMWTEEWKANGDPRNAIQGSLDVWRLKRDTLKAKGADFSEYDNAIKIMENRALEESEGMAGGSGAVREYFRQANRGKLILQQLKVPGFIDDRVKLGKNEQVVDPQSGEVIVANDPNVVVGDGGSLVSPTGEAIHTNPKTFPPTKPLASGMSNWGVVDEATGNIKFVASLDPNIPDDLARIRNENLADMGNFNAPLAAKSPSDAAAEPTWAEIIAPSGVDVTGGKNVRELGTGIWNGVRAAFERTPVLHHAVEAGEQIDAQWTLGALRKDIEAAKANNPRYAEGEMKRLYDAHLVDIDKGVTMTETDLVNKLSAASREFNAALKKAEVNFRSSDKITKRHAAEDGELLSRTLEKIDQILRSNQQGPPADGGISKRQAATNRLNEFKNKKTQTRRGAR
jgi:hypothetical protein